MSNTAEIKNDSGDGMISEQAVEDRSAAADEQCTVEKVSGVSDSSEMEKNHVPTAEDSSTSGASTSGETAAESASNSLSSAANQSNSDTGRLRWILKLVGWIQKST